MSALNIMASSLDAGLAPKSPLLRRRYVGPPGRQVHLTEAGPLNGRNPLCCLHATAYSARSLEPFLQAMALHRRVIALDTPGYGESDRPAERPAVEGYARLIDAALEDAREDQVDLFGYHTGALLAAEVARLRPDRVRRLVMIGIPFLEGTEQEDWRKRLAHPAVLTERLEQFQERWDYLVRHRPAALRLERAFENFVDELRAYPYNWWAHEAAFTFDVRRCLSRVRQPTLVLNPANHLSEPSRQAAEILKDAELREIGHLNNAIFDAAPEELASVMSDFLNKDIPAHA